MFVTIITRLTVTLALGMPMTDQVSIECAPEPPSWPRLYSDSELLKARSTYTDGIAGNFKDLIARLPDKLQAQARTIRLALPDRGLDPLSFYTKADCGTVFVPLESVQFIDDVLTALQYRTSRRCDPAAVYDYVGAVLTQRISSKPFPTLGVPKNVLKNEQTLKTTTTKLLNGLMYFILAHELGHAVMGHARAPPLPIARANEEAADAFALDAFKTIGVTPGAITLYFQFALYGEQLPYTEELSSHEQYIARPNAIDVTASAMYAQRMGLVRTHPTSPDRIRAVSERIKRDRASFVVTNSPTSVDAVTSDLDKLVELAGDVRTRCFAIVRAQRRPLSSMATCKKWVLDPGRERLRRLCPVQPPK